MKKILLSVLLLFFSGIIFMGYLFFKYPSIDYFPEKYELKKINSFTLFIQKFYEYKINSEISIKDINDYPYSEELLKHRGYQVKKWHLISDEERKNVTKYILNYLLQDHYDKKEYLKPITEKIQDKEYPFLFAKIGIYYGCCENRKIDLSNFFLINITEKKLYSFKMIPHI